jgi:hypothetical protein
MSLNEATYAYSIPQDRRRYLETQNSVELLFPGPAASLGGRNVPIDQSARARGFET